MTLTAEDLGIKDKSLMPFFCCSCGSRIGWTREEFGEEDAHIYCEDCAKEEPKEEEN